MTRVLLVTSEGACGIAEAELDRIEREIRVDPATGCWLWLGPIQSHTGYGAHYTLTCRIYRAHRLVYRILRGVPGPALDHLCRNKRCVNPSHLESVSFRENTLRGVSPAAQNARKTHCKRGHVLNDKNCRTKQGRHGRLRTCRECEKIQARHRWELFKRLHPPETREAHWGKAKDPLCASCRVYVEMLHSPEVRLARLASYV